MICSRCNQKVPKECDVCPICGAEVSINNKLQFITNNSSKTDALSVVISIMMIVVGIKSFIDIFPLVGGLFSFYSIIETLLYLIDTLGYLCGSVGFVFTAIILISKQHRVLLKISILLIGVCCFTSGVLYIFHLFWWFHICNVMNIIACIMTAMVWVLNIPDVQRIVKINFSKPILIGMVVGSFALIILERVIFGYYGYFGVFEWIALILEYIALVLFIILEKNIAEERQMENSRGNNNYRGENANYSYQNYTNPVNGIEAEGYIQVWILVVLSIVTFGIYALIWVYRTAGFLNRKLSTEQQSNQVAEILLYLFVPFYWIYWIYKTSKRVEEYGVRCGIGKGDLPIIGLLLAIFTFGIVAIALMQNQINKTILIEFNGGTDFSTLSYRQTNYGTDNPTHKQNINSNHNTSVNKSVQINMDEIELLKQLKELLDEGILTQEEFDYKKKELLK